MRLGVTAQRAGNLAAIFTDQGGERSADWRSEPDHMDRTAGHLFPNGSTSLVAGKDGTLDPIISAVTNASPAELVRYEETGALVADIGKVVDRVMVILWLADQRSVPAIEHPIMHSLLE